MEEKRTLWTLPNSHIYISRKPDTHLLKWHLRVPPCYTTMKRGRSINKKQMGSDWLFEKIGLVGKVNLWMSGMQPDAR